MVKSPPSTSPSMELTASGTLPRSKTRRRSWFSGSLVISAEAPYAEDDEEALQLAALQRLPTYDKLRAGVLRSQAETGVVLHSQVDVRSLTLSQRQSIINNLIKAPEEDNDHLLKHIRKRIDRVGVKLPTVEVRFQDLTVNAKAYVGDRALPTLWNATRNVVEALLGLIGLQPTRKVAFSILKELNGVIQPSRLTLLLGPPSSGKTTLLLALAGQLDSNLQVNGLVTYNGCRLNEFVPQKTSSYINQTDMHIGELTVRETLDFSARCQGVGSRYDILSEVSRREKESGLYSDADFDIFMKATAMEGIKNSLQTDYIMKILGLDICADTILGDNLKRGVSGGQKKRVTTGEIIVGGTRTYFMDEISTGLDSSTTYQIVKCIGQLAHHMDFTIVMSLLQPAPETYELFDNIILLSEGHIVYQGPRESAQEFFESCGFKCPERKGVADFLQEVTSLKDQKQYWCSTEPYRYISATEFAEKFKLFHVGKSINSFILTPFDKSRAPEGSLAVTKYSLNRVEIFSTCFAREILLIKRNAFVFIFKASQIIIMGAITMSVFWHTRMHRNNEEDGTYYLGALYYAMLVNMFNGYPEVPFTLRLLPTFFKQRKLLFYPAWAYSLPIILTRLPISILESAIWMIMTYYTIGFAPEASRFFKQFLLIFALHQMAGSLFRLIAGVCRTEVLSGIVGPLFTFIFFLLGGFITPKSRIPKWWSWGYWVSPMTYVQNALSVNELLAPQWDHPTADALRLGTKVLEAHGIPTHNYWYWLGTGVVFSMSVLFNILFTVALTYMKAPGKSQVIIGKKTLEDIGKCRERKDKNQMSSSEMHYSSSDLDAEKISKGMAQCQKKIGMHTPKFSSSPSKAYIDAVVDLCPKRGMILPFQPLTMSFKDIRYSVDMPQEMREQGVTETRLELLQSITGAFRPGVLTALMGVSGAGKTTLMDVLAGRKTGGYIEGDIRISGFPKHQQTFARISGYCEQNDVHSPQLTVHESLLFSAWLRLSPEINASDKRVFVNEVMELVELDSLRDVLVGIPSVSGLSTEQRKRLTIAVELVANPSIIFMDEPTSGLDARAAAIVMRTVRNTVNTGRTVVCTIHQPSIDIFDAFDELLLLKSGGQVIYAGPLGNRSSDMITYFQSIPGVPRLKDGCNPATWMLEVTSTSVEAHLNVDFAAVYSNSDLFKHNTALVEHLSEPAPDAKDLTFRTQYSQSIFGQMECCLWKQRLTYWRSPAYNCNRLLFTAVCALILGSIYWKAGQRRNDEQGLITLLGAIYVAVIFLGINNCIAVQAVVAVERAVFYRERGAGMYSAFPYAITHVLIEIPYVFMQTCIYTILVYSMLGLEWSPTKFVWFFFTMLFTFLYFTYYGMMAVAVTPNIEVASIMASTFYSIFNLFSGFFVFKRRIPGWWIWYYWICPVAWSVYGVLTSQFGDVREEVLLLDGSKTTIKQYLEGNLGYSYDFLGVVAGVLVGFALFFAFMYAFAIRHLNFQTR